MNRTARRRSLNSGAPWLHGGPKLAVIRSRGHDAPVIVMPALGPCVFGFGASGHTAD